MIHQERVLLILVFGFFETAVLPISVRSWLSTLPISDQRSSFRCLSCSGGVFFKFLSVFPLQTILFASLSMAKTCGARSCSFGWLMYIGYSVCVTHLCAVSRSWLPAKHRNVLQFVSLRVDDSSNYYMRPASAIILHTGERL